MSEPTMHDVGGLQGNRRRTCARAGVLMVTLGLTASLGASPTVKQENAVAPETTPSIPETTPSGKAMAKRHWFQIGKASWYGGKFNGRKTANGETYDMYEMTCAHRTLPLGSWIRVTNLRNRRSTFLRVNDRGPMVEGRIVDLSYGAAQRLGVDGLAKVRIEEINPSDPKLAEQVVAQMRMDDPARMQPVDETVDTAFLAPANLVGLER